MKNLTFALPLLSLAALAGCGDPEPTRFVQEDASPTADAAPDATVGDDAAPGEDVLAPIDRGMVPIPDRPDPAGETVVYAHSDDTLFSVDPSTRMVRRVGTFRFPSGTAAANMTDLAVDAEGHITGVTETALFSIDPNTAQCTLVRALPTAERRVFVGLTWAPVGVLDPSREVLLGGATDGSLWRIDPATGRSTSVGNLPSGWGISGDMVSIAGAATYATVRRTTGTSTTDTLVTLAFNAGRVTMTSLGEVGFRSIYGLGYWRSTLYGFSRAGELVTINVRTGRGTRVSMPAMEFSGAGVTTVAPVAPP